VSPALGEPAVSSQRPRKQVGPARLAVTARETHCDAVESLAQPLASTWHFSKTNQIAGSPPSPSRYSGGGGLPASGATLGFMGVANTNLQQQTWRRAVPRMLATLIAAVLLFRFAFGLSWLATVALLIVVIVGGALYWRAFRYKLPPNSRRARFLIRTGRARVRAACTACGWRGEFSLLTRRSDGGQVVYLCPACGHEVGHAV